LKNFNEYLGESAKYAQVHNLVPNRPDDPDVHVKGFAVYRLSSLRKDVIRHLEEYAKQVERGNIGGLVKEFTDKYSNMKSKVLGLAEVEKELNTPQMKRKITLLRKQK
jgi:hypothetical protein